MDKKRRKICRVAAHLIQSFLFGRGEDVLPRVKINGMPKEYEVVATYYDYQSDVFVFMVLSPEFPVVEDGYKCEELTPTYEVIDPPKPTFREFL